MLQENEPTILIGRKPFMAYVTSVSYQIVQLNAKRVKIKARGKLISRAVDVAEAVTRTFLKNIVTIDKITTDSIQINNNGKVLNKSSITIELVKNGN